MRRGTVLLVAIFGALPWALADCAPEPSEPAGATGPSGVVCNGCKVPGVDPHGGCVVEASQEQPPCYCPTWKPCPGWCWADPDAGGFETVPCDGGLDGGAG